MLNTNDLLKTCGNCSDFIQLNNMDLKKVQNMLLAMANDIKYVCDKYNLNYTLGGGSALGAIRHQGFIPWDDDLDFNMPRKDLDEFIKIFTAEMDHKYWLHVPGHRKNYDLPFIQIRKKGTRVRNLLDMEVEECGLTIDIFPIDNTYDNSFKRMVHGIISTFLLFVLSCYRMNIKKDIILQRINHEPNLVKSIRIKANIAYLFKFFSLEAWLVISDKWFSRCKNDNSEYVVIPTGRKHFFGELYRRKELCSIKKTKFENYYYNITQDSHNYLTRLYGEYMQLPPEEKREKHILIEFDLDCREKKIG